MPLNPDLRRVPPRGDGTDRAPARGDAAPRPVDAELVRRRVRAGFYSAPRVMDELAVRLIAAREL